jgi:hypothetical protein
MVSRTRCLRSLVPVFAGALLASACASDGPASGGTRKATKAATKAKSAPQASLRRPLRIPRLERGQRCPVARLRPTSPAFARGLGDGPVYPLGFGKGGVLRFEYPPPPNTLFAGSEWGGQKILWVSDPKYEGPILIRGRQLDGPHEVRFQEGLEPVRELRLLEATASTVESGPDWREFPSYTRLRAPGCYAYQVDGTDFSDVIVFRAVVSS